MSLLIITPLPDAGRSAAGILAAYRPVPSCRYMPTDFSSANMAR